MFYIFLYEKYSELGSAQSRNCFDEEKGMIAEDDYKFTTHITVEQYVEKLQILICDKLVTGCESIRISNDCIITGDMMVFSTVPRVMMVLVKWANQ